MIMKGRGAGVEGAIDFSVVCQPLPPIPPSPPFLLLSLEMCTVRQYRAGRYDGREGSIGRAGTVQQMVRTAGARIFNAALLHLEKLLPYS